MVLAGISTSSCIRKEPSRRKRPSSSLLASVVVGVLFSFVTMLTMHVAVVEARWNATGTVRTLWATPVMEYSGLFSDEQLDAFAQDVKTAWSNFLRQRKTRSRPRTKSTAAAFGLSTPNDKDKINEEFFTYQRQSPIRAATLDTVWQGFVFACQKFLEETGVPPIAYQRETVDGGALEWTTSADNNNPVRGKQYCWGSVQFGGTHHDVHTHPGSALAGTLYLAVPTDHSGGVLSLSDPRGPMPPFNYAYRIEPTKGMYVIFPGTVPHAVHATSGDYPRISMSCNYPGDWSKFTRSKITYGMDSSWTHEMMSRQEQQQQQQE